MNNLEGINHRRLVKILLGRARGGNPSHFRSRVIFSTPKCMGIKIFRGAAPHPGPPDPSPMVILQFGIKKL